MRVRLMNWLIDDRRLRWFEDFQDEEEMMKAYQAIDDASYNIYKEMRACCLRGETFSFERYDAVLVGLPMNHPEYRQEKIITSRLVKAHPVTDKSILKKFGISEECKMAFEIETSSISGNTYILGDYGN